MAGGGGGGAGAPGGNPITNVDGTVHRVGGNGGMGIVSTYSGTPASYAGGGGGGCKTDEPRFGPNPGGTGGWGGYNGSSAPFPATGGGGRGATYSGETPGQDNTGGGGGGGGDNSGGATGGSGVVLIRYPSSNREATSVSGASFVASGGFNHYRFTGSGSIQF